jgi:putative transposase
MKQVSTYSFSCYDDRFFELCKEAGEVYSAALNTFWEINKKDGVWLSKFDLQKKMKGRIERKNLHSDSYLAAMQQVHNNLASWKEAKKAKPEEKPPYKHKFLQPIFFKQSQIKYKEGMLILTLDRHKNYLMLPWNKNVPLPIYGHVGYNKTNGWKINLAVELDIEICENLSDDRTIVIDLGVRRIAALFDGERVITLSGKPLMALANYRNKTGADYQRKLKKKVKGSKRAQRLRRGRRKKVERLQNIQKDTLHKQSRFVVDYATNNNFGEIIFGNNAGTHSHTNCGDNNQKVQQFPEQKLRKYITYKFERVSGTASKVPEPYTSQKCPLCGKLNKPKGRTYKCKPCNYTYDRDGVGGINIYIENVSLVEHQRIRRLARPFGVKFYNHLSYKHYSEMLNVSKDCRYGKLSA